MSEKEIQEVLDELNTVRPEKLNEQGKRLFEAIMKIADERDELKQKVNKAIECMMKYSKTDVDDYNKIVQFYKDMKIILQGSD